jgi:hypothetical protein
MTTALPPPARASEPSQPTLGALSPLRLPLELRLSPEQFSLVCHANPEAVFELDAGGLPVFRRDPDIIGSVSACLTRCRRPPIETPWRPWIHCCD